MFWLERLIRLVRPMPPMPTPAMLSISLGGVNPRPRTCRVTMAIAAPPVATFVKNLRRDKSLFFLMSCSLFAAATIALSGAHCECKVRGVGYEGFGLRLRSPGTKEGSEANPRYTA